MLNQNHMGIIFKGTIEFMVSDERRTLKQHTAATIIIKTKVFIPRV